MKLAVSNTGWDPGRLSEVLPQLSEHGVKGLVIAPSLVWEGAPDKVTRDQARNFRHQVEDYGLKIVGMQSLGERLPEGLTLESREVVERLKRQADLAGRLGATSLVLGSPALRPSMMDYEQVVANLSEVAKVADDNGTSLNIKPLSTPNTFITTTHAGASLAKDVHLQAMPYRGFGLHLDAASIAGQLRPDPAIEMETALRSTDITSFSASAPNLGSLRMDSTVNHATIANALYAVGYDEYVTLVMNEPRGSDPIRDLLSEVTFVKAQYGLKRQ